MSERVRLKAMEYNSRVMERKGRGYTNYVVTSLLTNSALHYGTSVSTIIRPGARMKDGSFPKDFHGYSPVSF